MAESVQRGTRVVVAGTLKPREFEHNGEKRMSLDVDADSVALDVRFRPVRAGERPQRQSAPQAAQSDPWQAPQSSGGVGNGFDAAPF